LIKFDVRFPNRIAALCRQKIEMFLIRFQTKSLAFKSNVWIYSDRCRI